MPRSRANHDERKQTLIKISFELFMKNGYEGTSIQDIMNAAQISKGAMYHYFTSKEDILDAVLNYIIDLDEERVEFILNDTSLSALEKITAASSFDIPQTPEEIQRANEYIVKRPASIFDYRARELSMKRSIPSIVSLIEKGIESGEFRTEYPEEVAVVIFTMAQSVSGAIIDNSGAKVLQKKINAFIQLLTSCLDLNKGQQDYLTKFFNEGFKLHF